MKRMEVRDAADSTRLIGTLPVPDAADVGDRIRAVVMKPPSRLVPPVGYRVSMPTEKNNRVVTLVVQRWWNGNDGGFAIQAGSDLPIETLRLIPGFIEAKS